MKRRIAEKKKEEKKRTEQKLRKGDRKRVKGRQLGDKEMTHTKGRKEISKPNSEAKKPILKSWSERNLLFLLIPIISIDTW